MSQKKTISKILTWIAIVASILGVIGILLLIFKIFGLM